MKNHKIPVRILTGFLGSGKTSLLNEWMRAFPSKKYAIIENELGAESIDSQLIEKPTEDVFELKDGCLCCSLNDNLYELLEALTQKREEFDELIIETTGIADPSTVALPFKTHPAIENHFELRSVIAIADAQHIEDQLKETAEAALQIGYADIILINKIDTVSDLYVKDISSILIKINPFAEILQGTKGNYPVEELDAYYAEEHSGKINSPNHQSNSHQHGDIKAIHFSFEEAFDVDQLQNRLWAFLMFQSQSLYRIKGVVHHPDYDHRIIIQGVGKKLVVEKGVKWNATEQKRSLFVFIGRNLKEDAYRKILEPSVLMH
ncbi:MAG: GTP-binding protein [Cyclobacteriaceae bacterium]|nr:GTP-binding protein [Cyclobacteriaceae bacterium]MCH8515148.1 GTP-binding protein [Cyclobacteriaceae bacterium]